MDCGVQKSVKKERQKKGFLNLFSPEDKKTLELLIQEKFPKKKPAMKAKVESKIEGKSKNPESKFSSGKKALIKKESLAKKKNDSRVEEKEGTPKKNLSKKSEQKDTDDFKEKEMIEHSCYIGKAEIKVTIQKVIFLQNAVIT